MTEPDDDPRALFQQGMADHRVLAGKGRELSGKSKESQIRAAWLRNLRVANHLDELAATLLEGR